MRLLVTSSHSRADVQTIAAWRKLPKKTCVSSGVNNCNGSCSHWTEALRSVILPFATGRSWMPPFCLKEIWRGILLFSYVACCCWVRTHCWTFSCEQYISATCWLWDRKREFLLKTAELTQFGKCYSGENYIYTSGQYRYFIFWPLSGWHQYATDNIAHHENQSIIWIPNLN